MHCHDHPSLLNIVLLLATVSLPVFRAADIAFCRRMGAAKSSRYVSRLSRRESLYVSSSAECVLARSCLLQLEGIILVQVLATHCVGAIVCFCARSRWAMLHPSGVYNGRIRGFS